MRDNKSNSMYLAVPDESLHIRSFVEEDVTENYVGWLNDKSLMRYSNQRFINHTLSTSRTYLKTFTATDNLFLAICDPQDQLVGTMTAYRNMNHQTVDLGILIGQQFTGKGFGKAAWDTMIRHFINDGLTRKITAGCVGPNLPMIKLAEGSGMALEGRRVDQEICENALVDILLFGKIVR
ncbi:GNAT family protein [Litorivicinus sp.]|nr:GNAT family protein [Litorivicinus sp.]